MQELADCISADKYDNRNTEREIREMEIREWRKVTDYD